MTKVTPVRGGQWPIVTEITIDFSKDTVVTTNGTEVVLNKPGTYVCNVMAIPVNAVIVSGQVVTSVQFNSGTGLTIMLGTASAPQKYAYQAATSKGVYQFDVNTPTQYATGEEIQATFQVLGTGTVTSGVVTIRVTYVIPDRINETIAR